MSRKAETIYTSRMLNKAAHEKREAAREARRVQDSLTQLNEMQGHGEVCYANVSGVILPLSQKI